MNILITGGNGFIGSHLLDSLAASKQHQIVVLDLYPRAYEPAPENVTFITGNLDDVSLLGRILIDLRIEVVYHLAWTTISESAIKNPAADISQNLIPTVNLLDACISAKVRQVIYLSSGGTVYGIPKSIPVREDAPTNPISAYGITKLAAEKYIRMYHDLFGLEYVIFRPSVPYGPRQNPNRRQGAVSVFIYKVLRGETINIWGDGETLRDYFYVTDLTSALLAALDKPKLTDAIFNLAGQKTYTLNQLVSMIEKVLGIKADVMYESGRKFDVPSLQLDIYEAVEKLNWLPTTEMDDGIRNTAIWIRKWFI
jgi:UDP-glucose 4-epimerase